MIYSSASEWSSAAQKRVLLFGMSGLGKTHVSNMLRESGEWFHYSVDYRIGTRYMGEDIVDNFKREAMKTPFLAELLRSNSIYIASNLTFENLAPLSTYLGKPGNTEKGGLPFAEYLARQDRHRTSEIASLLDSAHFIQRADDLYGYQHFVCDTGGSICEVVDPSDPKDPVMTALSDIMLPVWIKGSPDHKDELVRRFDRAPKPMYYQPEFLDRKWNEYLSINSVVPSKVNPNDFIRWAYSEALAHRQPRYEAMANWGVTIDAKDVSRLKTPSEFDDLIARALAEH